MEDKQLEKMLAELQTELDAKTEKFFREVGELREMVYRGDLSTERANMRITELEKNFESLREEVREITGEVKKMNATVSTFSPKLDRFTDNLWKTVFALLMIIAGLFGIRIF